MGRTQNDLFEAIQLREWRARLTALVSGLFAFLAATGIFIYFGPFSVTAQVMVLLHTLIGLVFVVPYVMYQWHHWKTNRERPFNQHKLLGYLSLGAMVAVGVSGVWLTIEAGWGRRISYTWDRVHLIGGLIATALVVWHLAIIMVRHVRQNAGEKAARMRAAQGAFLWRAALILILTGAVTAAWVARAPTMPVRSEFPADYQLPFGENPFAPSLATTATGGALVAQPLGNSERCGDAGCHEQIVEEWSAERPPLVLDVAGLPGVQNGDGGQQNGPESTRYCGGCHDPIALFAGTKNLYSDDLSGIARLPARASRASSATRSRDRRAGNANYVVERRSRDTCTSCREQALASWARDFLIRAYPRQHVDDASPSGCSRRRSTARACHKQFIDEEINNVGWVQLQNQYDNWRQEPVARRTTSRPRHHLPRVPHAADRLRGSGGRRRHGGLQPHGRRRQASRPPLHRRQPVSSRRCWSCPAAEEHVDATEKWLRGEHPIPEIADKWEAGPAVPLQIDSPGDGESRRGVDVRSVITSTTRSDTTSRPARWTSSSRGSTSR